MADNAKQTTSTVIPGMRYLDAHAAIDWLCDAFGFEKKLVVPDGQGGVAHAQLTFGNGMIMLGSARDDDFGKLVKSPAAAGGGRRGDSGVLRDRRGRRPAIRQGHGGRRDRGPRHSGRGLRRSWIHVPRPRRAYLEFRHVRSVA